jgi:hypothetical protein
LARYPIKVGQGTSVVGTPSRRRTGTLVTRGFGRGQNIVMQGYSLMSFVKEALTRFITLGQSGAKRALQEMQDVIVWAKLLRVNDEAPKKNIQGQIRVSISKSATDLVVKVVGAAKVKARSAWEDLKITVKRIK